jgi:hypothetical protein
LYFYGVNRLLGLLGIPVKAASETGVTTATVPLRKRPVFRPETGQSG